MVKKTNFGPDFGPFWPKFGPQKKLSWVLPLTDVIHCCNVSLYAISKKTNEQNLRKWKKKTSFESNFGPFGQNLVLKNFNCVNSNSPRCYTLLQAIIVCKFKEN